MPVQHKYRPHHLALAIALGLGLGCADYTSAQELLELAESTNQPEAIEQSEPVTDPFTRLSNFINKDTTHKTEIGSPQPAVKGVSVKPDDRDDLIIVKNGGSFEGRVDGGKGVNVIQLIGSEGGQLGNTRNFDSVYVSAGTWTLTSNGDFKEGVLVLNDGTLTNDGKIKGGAFTIGSLINNGDIKGAVVVNDGGNFAGSGTVGRLDVAGLLSVGRLQGAPRIKGNLNISETGVLAYHISPDGSGETLKVDGVASIEGSTLKVHATPGGELPLNGNLTIIEAKKVIGEFGNIETNLAFFTVKPRYELKNVGLAYARNDVPIKSLATTDNARELGENIEEPTPVIQVQEVPENTLNMVELPILPTDETPAIVAVQTPVIEPDQPVLPAVVNAQTAIVEASQDVTADAPAVVISATATAETSAGAAAQAAVAQPVVVQPVAAQPTSVATAANPTAATPKPIAIAKNAAIAALLRSDKLTASRALEQLAGGNTANLAKATLNSDAPIGASMLSAMRQLDRTSNNFGTRNAPRLAAGSEDTGRVWLQALGHGGTLDRDRDALKHSSKGLVLGADWSVGEAWRLGMIGGKSDTRLDSRGLDGDLDSWHLGAYALRQSGPVSLRLGAAYSKHDAATKRRVAFNGFSDRLKGSYDANTQQAFAELGYKLDIASTSVEPFAGIGYQRYQRDSYTEKGGAAALQIHGQTRDNISSTFGLRLAKLNILDNGMQLTPRMSAGWKHTYGELDNQTRQRLVTGSRDFTVSGAALDRNSLLVDAGLDLAVTASHSLGIGLNGEVGTDSRNQGVTGQWRMSF
ncbi:autotransporter outer membrane beta-barrel domain-containing protein [Pseudomonas sp. Ant30-3]|uniref:autotransporter outer membrane beta-barrel domain-containing protein n=1 Tax=Pseudomonas sp. Ant30-3 TaxID=1488328 RepID=UPI0004904923|nr:autotransporter outer membrane beta-barrel domain-containing protein [Pseudomonas sp. Ant30-3]